MNLDNHTELEKVIQTYPTATKFFGFFLDDPLLDYLDKYGLELGFKQDNPSEETQTLLNKGKKFESNVIELIRSLNISIVEISEMDNWLSGAIETLELMRQGIPIIAQGYLINHVNKTRGRPDILIRSDYINKLKPGLLSTEEEKTPSIFGPWHYRVIDIKMTTLMLSADCKHISNKKILKAYKGQVLVYNLALNELQNYLSPHAYLLGRASYNYYGFINQNNDTFTSDPCLSSITAIDFSSHDSSFINTLNKAIEWHTFLSTMPKVEKLMNSTFQNEYDWDSLEMTIPVDMDLNLRPNMKNSYDYRWKTAKHIIAEHRQELTLLWNCGVAKRNKAIKMGITSWDAYLKYCNENHGYQNEVLATILEINDPNNNNLISPKHLDDEHLELLPDKKQPFIVIDFESANTSDYETLLPNSFGQLNIVFLIGVTVVIPVNDTYEYRYFPFMIKDLTVYQEYKIFKKMLLLLKDIRESMNMKNIVLHHWSNAELNFFDMMYERNNDDDEIVKLIEPIYFVDILSIFKYQPITIKGAYDFGLKSIAKAMYKNGMIKSIWDNDLNGFQAMLQIMKYNNEAMDLKLHLSDYQEVNDIILYNMKDCQVLAEIIIFLITFF
jgi:hypothetical protein